jgi:DUF1365 family protein
VKTDHCLMSGTVWHRRSKPVAHRFAYPLNLLLVDLDDIDGLLSRHWLWGRAARLVTLRNRDFVEGRDLALRDKVEDKAREKGLDFSGGQILMLAQPRGLGWLFNPLVLYFHLPEGARRPETALAQVSNTPWRERHFYAVSVRDGTTDTPFSHDKCFHVSPFLPMDLQYRWFIGWGEELSVTIEAVRDGDALFSAGMRLVPVPATGSNMGKMAFVFSRQSLLTSLRIYAQAFRLWRKKVPFFAHPQRKAALNRR